THFLSMILTYALGMGEKKLSVNILSISGVWGSAPQTLFQFFGGKTFQQRLHTRANPEPAGR
ncbi:MAG: hypothetical protein KAT05_08350, partial [Spirochaetes bacterium]|nr:hypothetical protein [Spirochaetota bacterium]